MSDKQEAKNTRSLKNSKQNKYPQNYIKKYFIGTSKK